MGTCLPARRRPLPTRRRGLRTTAAPAKVANKARTDLSTTGTLAAARASTHTVASFFVSVAASEATLPLVAIEQEDRSRELARMHQLGGIQPPGLASSPGGAF